MKHCLRSLAIGIAVASGVLHAVAAEPAYNFAKAFCKAFSPEGTAQLQSRTENGARILDFTVPPTTPSATLYTYIPVSGGGNRQISFEYQLRNPVRAAAGEAFMAVNFQSAAGGKSAHPSVRLPLNLRETAAGEWRRVDMVIAVPEDVGQLQAVLLELKDFGGDFRIARVASAVTAAMPPPEPAPPAYVPAKAYWAWWPRNSGIAATVAADRRSVVFEVQSPGDNPQLYTYCDLVPGRTYRVSFGCRTEKIIRQPNSASEAALAFQTAAGKPSGAPVMNWPLALPEAGASCDFTAEFTVPAGASRAQLRVLSLRGIAGKFIVNNLNVIEVRDRLPVARTDEKVTVDGKLDETIWADSEALTGFYRHGTPERIAVGTKAWVTYDDRKLYVAVRCDEPEMTALRRRVTAHDGAVWEDDSLELFIAVPNGKAVQLIFNTAGVSFDAELKQAVPGDPWRADAAWNGPWECAVQTDADGWSAEAAIAFSELGGVPRPDAVWRLNLVRDRRAGGDSTSAQWNCQFGALNNVDRFAELCFAENSATLRRCRENYLADPLAVNRKNPQFAKLPRRDGRYRVYGGDGSYLLPFYSAGFRKTNAANWPTLQQKMLAEMADAFDAPPLGYPWGVDVFGGREALEKLLQANHWRFNSVTHHTGQDQEAQKQGATFVRGRFVNAADPVLHRQTLAWTERALTADSWMIPYLGIVRGTDEPTNTIYEAFSRIKNPGNPAALERVDSEIRKTAGFGRYGLFDQFAANDDRDAPFRRIAFLRWWNRTVIGFKAEEQALLKKYAPGALYLPVVVNTVSTFRGIEVFPDFARVGDVTGVDPYPTATLAANGRERALYHTGFTTRLAHDLGGGNLVLVYLQGFNYHGRAPSPDNVREWLAQALKNGADIIWWYTDGNLENAPGIYEEILRLSRIVRAMRPLALPEKSPVAIFYNDIAAWGNFDTAQNAEYTLYGILGEQLKSNFRFISDVEVDDGRTDPGQYKLIIAPNLKYVTAATAEKLTGYVKNGGKLLILDPEAFAFTDDGRSPEKLRGELLGTARMPTAAGAFRGVVMDGRELPVESALKLEVPADAKIIARYPDGSAAAFERRYGNGTVICFAAKPFVSAKAAVDAGAWREYFAGLLAEAGETTGRPHWDFMIPAAL